MLENTQTFSTGLSDMPAGGAWVPMNGSHLRRWGFGFHISLGAAVAYILISALSGYWRSFSYESKAER